MRSIRAGAMSVALLACAGLVPAPAQTLSDPGAIRACLCEDQSVAALRQALDARRQTLDDSQKSLAALTSEVATRRAALDVYNYSQIDAFKGLLQQHDQAAAAVTAATESYDGAVARYNEAVAAYRSSCAGRSFDKAVLNSVEAALSCPRP